MDHHVHGYVTDYLRRNGIDCLTAEQDAHADEPDEIVLRRATLLERTIVTYDHDFFALHETIVQAGLHHAGILHIRSKSSSPRAVLDSLLLSAIVYKPSDMIDVLERHPF